jgi:hypothetical protein
MVLTSELIEVAGDRNLRRAGGLSWWLTPALFVLLPVVVSFAAWASLLGWCSVGGCPAGTAMELRGFLEPAQVSVPGVTLLIVWYSLVVVLATIGWRLGSEAKPTPEIVERTKLAAFERRYFLLIVAVATVGVGYSYTQIASATSIIDSLTTQTGNSFTEALPASAGVQTLRYATILAAPLSIYLWRKKVIAFAWMPFAVGLLILNSLIASRLAFLMAVVVYVIILTVTRKPTVVGHRKTVRPWMIISALIVMFAVLTGLNFVRNGNFYREAGVSNPVAMNAYQMGSYLAVPAQVSLGVSAAVMDGSFSKPGSFTEAFDAALPSFVSSVDVDKSNKDASAYNFAVSFSPSFTTNSEFADIYTEYGAWGWLFTLLVFPLAGFVFGRLLNYGPVIAGSGGVFAYCFFEVWRVQLITQGIVVFLLLLTLSCAWAAGSGLLPWRSTLRGEVVSSG